MDYHKLNQAVAPITVAVLDMVSLWEQIHITSTTCLWPLIWQILYFLFQSEKKSRKSWNSNGKGNINSIHLQFCPRAVLAPLPSVTI